MKLRYSKYYPSKIPTFSEVPQHWRRTRLKYLGFMYGGLTGKSGDDFRKEEEDPNNKPFIPFTNICNNIYISKNELKPVFIKEGESQNRVVKNDLFFLMSSETHEDIGKTSVLKEDLGEVYLNSFCKGFRLTDKEVNSYFLNYLLLGNSYRQVMSVEGNGFTRVNLRQDRVNDFVIYLPPPPEQKEIVKYIDKQTQEIDNLISITESKIELLKENRTALINQVITKGLDLNIEMKDSGVEWIGEIPKHWVINKLNRLAFFQEGPGLRTFQFTDDGVKVICVTNITENGIDFTYKKYISTEEYLEKYQHFRVRKGDLLLSSSGNSWGKVSEYLEDDIVILNTSTIRLNTLDKEKFVKNLIKYILKSDLVRIQLDILMTGSCQPNFGPTHLNQIVIPVAPILEQEEIVKYLDGKTQEIDDLIYIEQQRIETLKEYRQSLISEVVTGKVRVCEEIIN